MRRVRFFYDVVCPYAYLASTQVDRLADELGVEIEWVPMLLGGIFREIGAPQVPAAHMSPAKARMNTLDLERWARRWAVPFSFSPHHPQRSVEAMRLLCVTPPKLRPQVSAALFSAYWAQGARLDESLLTRVTETFQLGAQEEPTPWKSARAKEVLFSNTAEAAKLGVFGAPAFEVEGEIFWGQDRLHLVREALGGTKQTWIEGLAPPETEVTLYHDFSSPFSYLASTQAQALIEKYGARLTWKPILLGALFKEIGAPDVPLLAMSSPKRRYMGKDLQDWAKWWGVPFHFAKVFPLRTPTALRVALIDPSTTPAIYRAAWAEGIDIGAPEVLAQFLDREGYDGASLIEQTQRPEIKNMLRENTAEAQERGAFGVPSFELKRSGEPPQMYWGQDRLGLLSEALVKPLKIIG